MLTIFVAAVVAYSHMEIYVQRSIKARSLLAFARVQSQLYKARLTAPCWCRQPAHSVVNQDQKPLYSGCIASLCMYIGLQARAVCMSIYVPCRFYMCAYVCVQARVVVKSIGVGPYTQRVTQHFSVALSEALASKCRGKGKAVFVVAVAVCL